MHSQGFLVAVAVVTVLCGACTDEQSPSDPGVADLTTVTSLASPPEVISVAGNIGACDTNNDEATAKILDGVGGTVFTLGDNAFPNGTLSQFNSCYTPTWGRHKSRTWAALGNHDYDTGNADGAYDYFGSRAGPRGKGYYSLNLGGWHIIVLNDAGEYDPANTRSSWATGSPQEQWLRADLAANGGRCLLAIWHVPLFLSSNSSGYIRNTGKRNLWDLLYAARADVVLNGQQHHYERMALMRPDGTRNLSGIRQFIVGTGGADGVVLPTVAIHPNSQVRAAVMGVLSLTLYPDRYEWKFRPVAGQSFTDSGSQPCHNGG
jgi:hypothetical protein